jgi:hypothetical protein
MPLVMGVTLTYSFAAYIAVVLSMLPLLGLAYYRPYRNDSSSLNACSAFLNLAFPLVASIIYLANNMISLSELGCLLSAVLIMIWLIISEVVTVIRMVKMVPWRDLPLVQKCLKKKKKMDEGGLLDKNKVEAEMSSLVKDSIKGDGVKIVDWEEKNKKDYESISNKPDNDEDA